MTPWFSSDRPILCLAPMAGYTDSAFRQLVKELAPNAVVFSEFVSADGIRFNAKKTLEMLRFSPAEQPMVIQIFGKHPAFFAEAARVIESMGASAVDINMGCPARQVVHSGHGSDLIRNPCLAAEIVRATVAATKLPVTVKTRLGWSDSSTLLDFGKMLVDCGAQALTIHGRTVAQAYSGFADWDPIYELKKTLSVPVFGNGDIVSGASALEKIENLNGVMVGRASVGNPWVMREIAAALAGDPIPPTPHWLEKKATAIRHTELLVQTKGEKVGMLEIRKHLASYVRGISGAKDLREKLVRVESIAEVQEILDSVEMGVGE